MPLRESNQKIFIVWFFGKVINTTKKQQNAVKPILRGIPKECQETECTHGD